MNLIVEEMLKEMKFWKSSPEEVFKFHATALIEDFNVPATFVVDMMQSLYAAVAEEYGE